MEELRKQKLSVDEQIEHMKVKGIKFNIVSEDEAKDFISNHTYYFKVRSYAKNYDKYQYGENKGKYINLEFAYIQELSRIDAELRYFIIRACLDMEHFLKVLLLQDFAGSSEDGYSIVEKYLTAYPGAKDKINARKQNAVCFDLLEKYENNFAIWNIVEVLSFGDFINLYKIFYDEYPELPGEVFSNKIFPIKLLRNAAAHNSCLINSLAKPYSIEIKRNQPIQNAIGKINGISRTERSKKMKNPVIHDFVLLIYLYDQIIPLQKYRKERFGELNDLFSNRMLEHKDFFKKNDVITSTYRFLKKIVDYYHGKCNNFIIE